MARFILVIFLSLSSYLVLSGQSSAVKIFTAVKNNDIKELKTLVDLGADPNSYDEDGDHLLMYAALYSSIDCMQLLIGKGCNVNAKNGLDETALMWAVHDLEKMKLLIQHGADVNTKARTGNTALLIASVGHGKYDAVKLLLDKGADASALNNKKENALIRAALFGDTATISLLLGKGLLVDAMTADSSTALLNATLNANKPVIFQLLEKGADPDKICSFGLTPLTGAVLFSDPESVKAILKRSKKVNAQDAGGNTVLMYAGYREHDNVEVIQALLEKGADVNIKAKDGATALSWASKKGNTATVALLKKVGAK
ncbi:MAG TPA: ankyrin repeat domain-containing protein [Chitinophagaceae bacterium]|nr:ankyrin repeat domain-containing protein [Chitinophagaceae bacterium]